jgi:hypothetical protein
MTRALQTVVRTIAAGRVVVGGALLASPQLAEAWAGKDVRRPGGQLLTRALGARDAALGAGTLASAGDPAQLRRWLVMSGVVDAADFAATLAGPRAPARTAILATAVAASAACLAAAASSSS